MGRRRAVRQDSLELLLDTICNTFGGVLFIAIMVVMLLQQTGGTPEIEAVPPPPEEILADATKLKSLSRELTRLQEIQTSQTAVVGSLVPETVRTLLERRKQLLTEQTSSQEAVDLQRSENATLVASVEQTYAKNRQLLKDLNVAIKERLELESQLETERQARTQEVRLPVLRSKAGKREVAVIVRYGRVYLWHEYDQNENRVGLNTRDFVVIDDSADKIVARPNPLRGIRLDNSEGAGAAIRRMLSRFDPQRFYVGVIVRPDSYGVFQHFRNQLLTSHFEYRLVPVDADTSMTDTGGSGGEVQ